MRGENFLNLNHDSTTPSVRSIIAPIAFNPDVRMADDDFHNAYHDDLGPADETSIISVRHAPSSLLLYPGSRLISPPALYPTAENGRSVHNVCVANRPFFRPTHQTRGLEAFGRKVTTTASHLMGTGGTTTLHHSASYQTAMGSVQAQLMRRPAMQRGVLALARTTPTDLVRSSVSRSEIRHRALAYLPDELLAQIPERENTTYSLFQGFQASFPEFEADEDEDDGDVVAAGGGKSKKKTHRRRVSRGRKMLMLEESMASPDSPHLLSKLRKERASMMHELEMMSVRKNMASSEISDIDNKIANLNGMRRIVLERLAGLEQEEALLEHDGAFVRDWNIREGGIFCLTNYGPAVCFAVLDVENRLEEAAVLIEEAQSLAAQTPTRSDEDMMLDDEEADGGFMSQSIYMKLPSAGGGSVHSTPSKHTGGGSMRRPRATRRRSVPVLHGHMSPGSNIRELRAHGDSIATLDFDAPFAVLATAGVDDDEVRVWDLNAGRCMGTLEGHAASVRALQIEDNLLATGSADATIRLWDLSRAHYDPTGGGGRGRWGTGGGGKGVVDNGEGDGGEAGGDRGDYEADMAFEHPDDHPLEPPAGSMSECELFTLRGHVGEVTALYFSGDTMVSGSADKTLRQWDLDKGRCVQTLDVMWAAAQSIAPHANSAPISGSTTPSASDSAAGKASADDPDGGMWRPTQRSAPASSDFVGALQVFDAALACGTADGLVRLWDLRSGQVHRSLVGHTGPVTSLQFDDVHLVTGSLDRSIRVCLYLSV